MAAVPAVRTIRITQTIRTKGKVVITVTLRMCAFTFFVGTKTVTSERLAQDGFVPDVVVSCRRPGKTAWNDNDNDDDGNYTNLGCAMGGMAILRHKHVNCVMMPCLHAALIDVFGTRVLVSNGSRLQAVPLLFQRNYDVSIGGVGRSSGAPSVVCTCTSRVVLTHEEALSYGHYFVFDAV